MATRTRSGRSSGISSTAPAEKRSVTARPPMTSTGENVATFVTGFETVPSHLRRQYQNVDTDTRSREQNRATVRPDVVNRPSRCCQAASFF